MNILQILPELNVGGVETGTVDFSRCLVSRGHRSVVVSNGGVLVERLEKDGGVHYAMPVHRKNLGQMIRLVKPLREIIRKENIDIVHARSRVPAWIAFFACRKTGAAFITTCHGHYGNRWFSRVMGWAKLVIVPSQVIGRHMVDHYGVPVERIRCIPRGVNLRDFHNFSERAAAKRGESNIALVGRITPLKGHSYFFRAMAQVVRSYPFVRILVVGDAPEGKPHYKTDLERLAASLGIARNVSFMGRRPDIPDVLSGVDILVAPSVEPESFGRVVLEAQAAAVPVVATQTGGFVEIIDHQQTGLLVPPKDVDALARAILRLLKDPGLGKVLAEKAKIKLKKCFTVEQMAESTVKVYEELLGRLNILVIKLGSAGDIVLITASLKALRHKFPKAVIKCLVNRQFQKILKNCPYIDEVIVCDAQGRDRGLSGFFRMAGRLRAERFDKIVDFQNNKKSHWWAFLSFARETYGYNNGKWGFLLTHPVEKNRTDTGPVEHQFEVLRLLGISMPPWPALELWPGDKEREYVSALFEAEWLSNNRNIVGLNISASARWPTKNWPLEYMARLADQLAQRNIRVLVTGTRSDGAAARKFMSLCKSKPANLVGKTDILQLAAVVEKCKVFISPDSAPLHIAAAMNVPAIAFFGPTAALRHVPPSKKLIVLQRDLQCRPCYSGRCRILTHACMREIHPDEVESKVVQILGETT
jgi:lipopolysaccharide heptosyltransferase II